MAKKNKTQWVSFVNTNINTNGTQAITGALLNEALIDLADSIFFSEIKREKEIAISTAGTTVTFDAPYTAGTFYALGVRCYDALGNPIDVKITSISESGFDVLPPVDGFIDYSAIEKGTI